MRRWSKIFTLGDKYTDNIFQGPVQVTEKVDGSQFNFGYNDKDGLWMLSKGSTVHLGDNNKLFHPAAEHVHKLYSGGKLVNGWSYHGETLHSRTHNTLSYDRVPKNNIALYGIIREDGTHIDEHERLSYRADELDVDVVALIFEGEVSDFTPELLNTWLKRTSFLGAEQIEGFVVKNYGKELFVGGRLLNVMQGKFVSEAFKERHSTSWPTNNKSPLIKIGEMVRTEARWRKAIEKLRDSGKMEQHPRDIGTLLKLLHQDLDEEDKEVLKDRLWNEFSKDIKRAAVRGFPEFYKYYLATGQIKMNVTGEDYKEAGIG